MYHSGIITYPVFKPVSLTHLRGLALPERNLLLAPWLAESSLTLIHGPRGIGKTRLSLAIAHAIASGTSLLGWHTPAPRRVLLIDGEMPIQDLQAACATLPAPAAEENLRLLAMDLERDQLDLTQHAHRFRLEDHLTGVDLVVIDNLATLAAGGGENAAETWLPIEAWAREQRRAGRAVIFIHHSGRLGHQRGTTRREDRMDTILALRPTEHTSTTKGASFEIHLEKHRGSLPPASFPLIAALRPDGWHATPLATDPRAAVAALTHAGKSIRAIASAWAAKIAARSASVRSIHRSSASSGNTA